MEIKPNYKAHLFVCTNSPEKPGKCGHKNAEDLRRRLKERAKIEFGKSVRVNMSGCLGHCEHGIACVIYPQEQWFLELNDNPRDEERLFDALKSAVATANAGESHK